MTAADRPIARALRPIETGNYRVATPAIEAFYALVERCLRYCQMRNHAALLLVSQLHKVDGRLPLPLDPSQERAKPPGCRGLPRLSDDAGRQYEPPRLGKDTGKQ